MRARPAEGVEERRGDERRIMALGKRVNHRWLMEVSLAGFRGMRRRRAAKTAHAA